MKLHCLCLLLISAASRSTSVASGPASRQSIPKTSFPKVDRNSTSSCTSPWQYNDDGECKCGEIPPFVTLKCKVGENLTLLNDYCVTMSHNQNQTMGYSTYIGSCLYQMSQEGSVPDTPADLNEFVCGRDFNRTGILCGDCKEDHYPLVYSLDSKCVKCSNKLYNIWKFIIAALLPLTAFYLILVLFHINIASSYLNGYVLCCQGMVMPTLSRLIFLEQKRTLVDHGEVIGSLLSIWNLDIFRFLKLDICLETNSLQTLTLDLVVGIYPLLLIILSCLLLRLYDNNFKIVIWLWRPFKAFLSHFHKTWEIKTSLIDAFASFLLLSNLKFLNVVYDLLTPVTVYQLNSSGNGNFTHSWRLYYDATVLYFGKRHLPYAILAMGVLVLFAVTPMLLLILYPFRWFQKLLNLLPFRMHALHTFIDTFQGCYKDGTEPGTRDCRWFASLFCLLRSVAVVVGAATMSINYFFYTSLALVLAALLFIVVQPFKPHLAHYSTVNATFLLLLAVWYTGLAGWETARLNQAVSVRKLFQVILELTAVAIILFLSVIILKWMWSQRKFGRELIRKIYAKWQGYADLQ